MQIGCKALQHGEVAISMPSDLFAIILYFVAKNYFFPVSGLADNNHLFSTTKDSIEIPVLLNYPDVPNTRRPSLKSSRNGQQVLITVSKQSHNIILIIIIMYLFKLQF